MALSTFLKDLVTVRFTARQAVLLNGLIFDWSTTEQEFPAKTGGVQRYAKKLEIANLPNSTSENHAHGITGLAEIEALWGVARNGTTEHPMPWPATISNGYIGLARAGDNIVVTTGINWSAFSADVYMIYTKS